MQQSCPKNVHSGPHIGSNNNSGGSNNSVSSANNISSNNNNNNSNLNTLTNNKNSINNENNSNSNNNNNNSNNMLMNHSQTNNNNMSTNGNNSNNNSAITISNNLNSSNTNNSSSSNINSNNLNNTNLNSSKNHNSSLATMNVSNGNNVSMLPTSRGPVKNNTQQQQQHHPHSHQQHQQQHVHVNDATTMTTTTTTIETPTNILAHNYYQKQPHTENVPYDMKMVKEELNIEEQQHQHQLQQQELATIQANKTTKSQYEEHVVHPPTPPDSYTNVEEKLQEDAPNDIIILDGAVKQTSTKLANHKNNAIEAFDLSTTPTTTTTSQTTVLNSVNAETINNNNTNNNKSLVNNNTTIGRKARIGKNMAREMVYAAVQQQPTIIQVRSPAQLSTSQAQHEVSNFPSPLSLTTKTLPVTTPQALAITTPNSINIPTTTTTTTTRTSHINIEDNYMQQHTKEATQIAMVLTKEEIKAEPIELKEEVLSAMLMSQHQWEEHINNNNNNNNTNNNNNGEKLKSIKTEPLSASIEDEVTIKNLSCVLNFDIEKQVETEAYRTKNKERMRLLPYWQQGTITGYIDRTKASIGTLEDEVLDLCKSPLYTIEDSAECEDKNQDFKKAATINGYKSLIKQAKPKSYLCLSRKAEKRARFNKLQLSRIHSSKLSSSKRYKLLRKRRLLLSTHQKKQLRLRRKKLMALHQERLSKKVRSNEIEAQQEMVNGGIEKLEAARIDNMTLKPPSAVLSDHKRLLAKVDKATGGYFSEPEHCSNCPTKGRKQKQKTKENIVIVPKRSKSETKQPNNKRVCLHANYLINNNMNNNNNNNNNDDDVNDQNVDCCNLKTNNMHVLKEAVQAELICKGKQTKRRPRVSTKKQNNKITNDDHMDDSENCYESAESVIAATELLAAENLNLQTKAEQIDNIQTQTALHSIDSPQFMQPILPPLPRIACHQHHNVATKRSRSRTKFGVRKRTKQKHSTIAYALDETLPAATRGDVVPKWNNGWTWEGEPFQGAVFLNVKKLRIYLNL